ncbi:MAG: DUF58 domain-containing protein [Woeseiaceae bacterium]
MSAELTASPKTNLRRRLFDRASQRVSRWIRKRQGDELLPVTLRAKRLYILPTSLGVTFAIVCFSMLLGSMNYNNSMGFALTFLLAATGLVAMHRCHQNLSGLQVESLQALRTFAGQTLTVEVMLTNPGSGSRYEIVTSMDKSDSEPGDIGPGQSCLLSIPMKTQHRGWHSLPRLGLHTRFPLTLLHCWVWLYIEKQALVWPRPAENAPVRPVTQDDRAGSTGGRGDDDFAGLRDYQRGDSSRRIAWKTFARSGELKSRQFEGGSVSTSWIDFAAAGTQDAEQALSVLCRWVLDADQAGDQYGLRLPGITIEPGSGRNHRDACLDALACFDKSGIAV